jgi:hypothetical protein
MIVLRAVRSAGEVEFQNFVPDISRPLRVRIGQLFRRVVASFFHRTASETYDDASSAAQRKLPTIQSLTCMVTGLLYYDCYAERPQRAPKPVKYLKRLSSRTPGRSSVSANVFHSPISHFTHLTPYLPKHHTNERVNAMRR